MGYVALDTDVVSMLIKRQLPATLLARLAGSIPCVSFVTIAELTEWAIFRSWGQRRHAELDRWLAGVPTLEYDDDVARMWGAPVRSCPPARTTATDQRHVECGVLPHLGSPSRHPECEGLPRLRSRTRITADHLVIGHT